MHRRLRFSAVPALVLLLIGATFAAGEDRLTSLWRHQGPLVLAAAASTNEAFAPLADEVLGTDWPSWEFIDLVGRLDPAELERGFVELRRGLNGLSQEEWSSTVFDMERWITCFRALESLQNVAGIEATATAVAMTPAVAAAFPRPNLIEKLGKDVGSTLTAGEQSELKYNVATRLTGMEEREIAEALRDLYDVAVDVGAENPPPSR
jgi:hypothetical protein